MRKRFTVMLLLVKGMTCVGIPSVFRLASGEQQCSPWHSQEQREWRSGRSLAEKRWQRECASSAYSRRSLIQ
jgi:hypothetical protein